MADFNINDRTTWDFLYKEGEPPAGLEDGNYPHWTEPGKFVSAVAQAHWYERDCVPGNKYDPDIDGCQDPALVPEERIYAYLVNRGLVNDQRT